MTIALPPVRLTPFIGGVFQKPGEREEAILDPATGELVARVAPASPGQVVEAIAAARRAFDEGGWPRMPVFERGQTLRAIADHIMARAQDFALLEAVNGGKPISEPGARSPARRACSVTTPVRWTSSSVTPSQSATIC